MSNAIKDAKIWLLEQVLPSMDLLKNDTGRDKFCANFDKEYERRQNEYKELTGRDWSGGNV